jgi:hypothetical protein
MKFNSEDRSFMMTPTQYIVLNHTTSAFPIHAHFANTDLKKRWGMKGPRVSIGSTVTFSGLLEQIIREHTPDRALQFAQVKVINTAYLTT